MDVLSSSLLCPLVDTGWGGVDWIGLAQDREKYIAFVNTVMNLRAP
jgi:hypothetical protein